MSERTLAVLDWKSSSYISSESRLQIAAYSYCKSLPKMPHWGIVVQVLEDKCRPAVVMDLADMQRAYKAFLGAKRVFDWMVQNNLAKIPPNEAYRVDGVFLPSVTYIMSHAIAKPGLLGWYAKMAREGKNPEQIRDSRAEEGKQIHHAIHSILAGTPVDVSQAPPRIKGTIEHFKAWIEEVKLKPVALEQKVVNERAGYAGTLDCLAWVSMVDVVAPGLWKEPIDTSPPQGRNPFVQTQKEKELAEFLDKQGEQING